MHKTLKTNFMHHGCHIVKKTGENTFFVVWLNNRQLLAGQFMVFLTTT